MVAQVRAEVTASAFPLKRDREISRQRGDREFKTAPLAANARPVPPESMRRGRGSFGAIPAITANHIRRRTSRAAATSRKDRRRATTQ
jgi:hypothetical protein